MVWSEQSMNMSLDFCNSILYNLPNNKIERLQRIQNQAARMLKRIPRRNHISTINNTSRKHNIHHIPYRNTQHTSTLKGEKKTLFSAKVATQQTFPQTSPPPPPTINRHKNKHAVYTYIYCLYASSHKRQ